MADDNRAVLEAVLLDRLSNPASVIVVNLRNMERAGDKTALKFLELNAVLQLSEEVFNAVKDVTEDLVDSFNQLQEASHVWELKDAVGGKIRLDAIVASMEDVGIATKDALSIASKLGREYDPKNAAQLAQLIEAVRGNLHLSASDTQALTEQLVKLGERATVGSRQIRALGESFGPGISAASEIAKVTGRSIDTINQQIKKNTLPVQDLINALAQSQLNLGRAATLAGVAQNAAIHDVQSQLQRLQNIVSDFGRDFAKELFGGDDAGEAIHNLGDQLKKLLESKDVQDFIHNTAFEIKSLIAPGGGASTAISALGTAFHDIKVAGEDIKDVFDFFASHREATVGALAALAAIVAVTVVPAFVAWAAATIAATWPILAIAAAFAGLVVVIDYLFHVDWNKVWGGIKQYGQEALDWLSGLPTKLYDLGSLAISSLADGIENAAHKVADTIKKLGGNAVDALKRIWDSHSPSKVFEAQGRSAPEGAALGIESGNARVQRAGAALGAEVANASRAVIGTSTLGDSNRQQYGDINFSFDIRVDNGGGHGNQGSSGILDQDTLRSSIVDEVTRSIRLAFSRASVTS